MKIFYLLFVITLIYACNSIPKSTVQSIATEKITVAPGPEDMVLDTFFSQPRLIISCNARRKNQKPFSEIMQYHLTNGKTSILERRNDNTLHFNPHGIDIRKIDNTVWLYVISHNDLNNKQEIITYKLFENYLEYVHTYTHPNIVSPNDVAITPNGSFYVTNDAKKRNSMFEKILGKRSSTVIFVPNELNAEVKIATQNLAFANGIQCLNNNIYVAATQKKELNEYHIQTNGTLIKTRNLARIKGLDNISLHGDWLIIPAHLNFIKFIKHASNSQNKTPSVVYAINRITGEQKILFSDNGKKISAASTALIYNGYLYISQVFDDFILKVKLNEDL